MYHYVVDIKTEKRSYMFPIPIGTHRCSIYKSGHNMKYLPANFISTRQLFKRVLGTFGNPTVYSFQDIRWTRHVLVANFFQFLVKNGNSFDSKMKSVKWQYIFRLHSMLLTIQEGPCYSHKVKSIIRCEAKGSILSAKENDFSACCDFFVWQIFLVDYVATYDP